MDQMDAFLSQPSLMSQKADVIVAALQWWDDAITAIVLGVCFANEMPMRDFDPVGCIGEWAGLRVWLSSL